MKSFPLGHLVATPGVLSALKATGENALTFIGRPCSGDWGDLDPGDRQENEFSLENDLRLLSAYHLKDDTKIWIITEADRSSTLCVAAGGILETAHKSKKQQNQVGFAANQSVRS